MPKMWEENNIKKKHFYLKVLQKADDIVNKMYPIMGCNRCILHKKMKQQNSKIIKGVGL